jgi:transposase
VDEIVNAIASKRDEQDLAVLFVDASHVSNEPYVQRGWLRAKAKRQVHQPKRRQSKTIFGASDLQSQRVYWKQAPKGHAGTLIAFLHQLHQHFPDQLFVLILANGSIHKSKKVKAFVAKAAWLELEHLAPYSPEHNPIERFWHGLKRKVYGCKSYKTIDGVISKIRKLIWPYHEGRLVTTIRFNFSAYVEIL